MKRVKVMKRVPLSDVKDDLSKYLRIAEAEQIIITRHGKPAGVLVGFASDDDWFDFQLEHDPRFLQRIEQARQSLRSGEGVKLEDVGDSRPSQRRGRKR
jgi:prevent-host-death family protein